MTSTLTRLPTSWCLARDFQVFPLPQIAQRAANCELVKVVFKTLIRCGDLCAKGVAGWRHVSGTETFAGPKCERKRRRMLAPTAAPRGPALCCQRCPGRWVARRAGAAGSKRPGPASPGRWLVLQPQLTAWSPGGRGMPGTGGRGRPVCWSPASPFCRCQIHARKLPSTHERVC